MKKWYRKTVVKAALLAVAIISGAMMTTNLLGALTLAGTANPVEVWKLSGQPFEESEDFNSMVQGMMAEVLERIRLEKMFETDGAYNSDKLVDVMEYSKKGSISGENSSGVAYTLEELESWSEDYSSGEGTIYDDNSVIVCERADGSYYYYYLSDFLALLNNRQMVLVMDGADPDQFLEGLENGEYTTSGQYDFRILDSEGEILYTDCWNFGESLREKFAPDGAENLLQIVNGNPQLNGKLSIIYDNLAAVLSSIYSDIQTYQSGWAYLSEGNTNFTYLYINEDTKRVQTNRGEYQDYEKAADNIAEMKEKDSVKYMVVYPKLSDFETNMSISVSNEWDSVRTYENRRNFNSIFAVSVDTDFPIQDQFYEGKQNYDQNAPFLKNSLILASAGGIFFLIAAIWLTMAAGRNEKDNALRLTSFDRWKTEIAVLVVLAVWGLGTAFFLAAENGIGSFSQFTNTAAAYYNEAAAYEGTAVYYSGMFTNMLSLFDITALFLYGLFTFACFFSGYLSLVKRIKGKRLWADSVCRMVLAFGATVFSERSVTARAGIVTGIFVVIQWLALASGGNAVLVLLMLAADIAVAYLVLSSAVAKGRLKKGIEEIASGNMNYKVPLGGIKGSNRKLAEQLNDIGGGLNKAVEEAMRNERLKTDLITNVSHDIKTPLTSIINYVDILKRENIQDPKIRGYLDILEAKAQRLKTLTEDVVEASKVSSGNIVLEYMDVDLSEMIQQTEGEFAEKFTARNLSVVVNLPGEPAVIHVDGRRMWRVLENIFGNAAKYAMPGTRVYADLGVDEESVSFSLKNVSEQQLNISADELTERFIRGDISRSTEGSGLGLSIAKSLTEMQGGRFELYLDGDLFRVNIRFPRVRR